MWSSLKTEAIVLSVHPWREHDREYRALTPAEGKVAFLGRGAQKPLAKLAAHLEPGAVVEVEVIRGLRSMTVINVERRRSFPAMRSSLAHRILMLSSLTLVDRLTKTEQEDAELYREVGVWLGFLDAQPELPPTRATFLLAAFLLRLQRRLGYEVELEQCVSCRTPILPLAFRWHSGRGGLVCTECIQRSPGDWVTAVPLREEVVQLLRLARERSFEDLLKFPLKAQDVEEAAEKLHDMLLYHVPGYPDQPFWRAVL